MYQPPYELLKKYADVLVKFALRGGKGINKWDTVLVQIPECAKLFYLPLQKSILEAWGHPIMEYLPDGVNKHFFDHASDDQLKYYPKHYHHGKIQQATHLIQIIAEADKYELQDIDPKKIAANIRSRKKIREERTKKETAGKLSRNISMYGTQAMADDVGMTLEEYWNEIIKACYLDCSDPIAEWKRVLTEIQTIKTKLNELKIQYVHITWQDVDLKIKIWSDRQWLGGEWCNIPSFEVFTSPDRRETNWRIRFNQPIFRYGQIINGVSLTFKNWVITQFDATENKACLKEIIGIPNTNKLGEFSLTDKKFSHITKMMGETLYDENRGWEFGNTHIAIGLSFSDTFAGDIKKLTKKDLKERWFNQSAEHVDIVSTTDRKVTATLSDGTQKVIYENGQFTL